jgi:hypothetical protein
VRHIPYNWHVQSYGGIRRGDVVFDRALGQDYRVVDLFAGAYDITARVTKIPGDHPTQNHPAKFLEKR